MGQCLLRIRRPPSPLGDEARQAVIWECVKRIRNAHETQCVNRGSVSAFTGRVHVVIRLHVRPEQLGPINHQLPSHLPPPFAMSGTVDAEMQNACEQFLCKKPFYGKVPVFKDKVEVKELCSGPGANGWRDVRWDPQHKTWGTMHMANIPKLLSSGKWEPVGIQRQWYGCLSQMAKARSYFEDGVKSEKQETKLAVITEQNEKERVAALHARREREETQEEHRKLKSMASVTDDEIQKMGDLGFDKGVAAYALLLGTTFGPVSGMSPEGRVLRWFSFKLTEARVKAYADTGSLWLTPEDIAPYYASARDWWVKELNNAARRGDKSFHDTRVTKSAHYRGAASKRRSYDHVDTGHAAAKHNSREEHARRASKAVRSEPVKLVPSSAAYHARCSTCQGTINSQFRECICCPRWVPCHQCRSFVAPHQHCRYGHAVEYPPV